MPTVTLTIDEVDASKVIGLLTQQGIGFAVSNREPVAAQCPHAHEPQTVMVEGIVGLAELISELKASRGNLAAIINDLRGFKAPQIEVSLTTEQINSLSQAANVFRSLMTENRDHGYSSSPLDQLYAIAERLRNATIVAERGGFHH